MQNSFEYISLFFIISGFLCGFIILIDILDDRPQKTTEMTLVWLLTGIWASWIGLFTYFKIGRTNKINCDEDTGCMREDIVSAFSNKKNTDKNTPLEKILLSTLICGAGCVPANLAAKGFSFFCPVYSGSSVPDVSWGLAYVLAVFFAAGFQYAFIDPEQKTDLPGKTLRTALKFSFPVSTAWQFGVYAYNSLIFNFYDLMIINSWSFWFMMQIAMFCGCLTACPVNGLMMKLFSKKQPDKGERPLKNYQN